jgi:hypothetical protein
VWLTIQSSVKIGTRREAFRNKKDNRKWIILSITFIFAVDGDAVDKNEFNYSSLYKCKITQYVFEYDISLVLTNN